MLTQNERVSYDINEEEGDLISLKRKKYLKNYVFSHRKKRERWGEKERERE